MLQLVADVGCFGLWFGQVLFVEGGIELEEEAFFGFGEEGLVFLIFFLFDLLDAFLDVFLYELLVLIGTVFSHLIKHFPDVVGHGGVFLVVQSEHFFEFLGNHVGSVVN